MDDHVTQIICTLIAGPLLYLLQRMVPLPPVSPPGSETVTGAPCTSADVETPRSMLDLAVGLVCSAFFSIVLIDSFHVSGRSPQLTISLVSSVSVITFGSGVVVIVAWVLRRMEAGIGLFAFAVIVSLLLSPGGAFIEKRVIANDEPGLPLMLPLLVLTLIASGSLLYTFGNPFDREINTPRRITLSTLLIVLVGVSSYTYARQLTKDILDDPRSPRFSDYAGEESKRADAIELLKTLRKSPTIQKEFYVIASEFLMEDHYRKNYLANIDLLSRAGRSVNQAANPRKSSAAANAVPTPASGAKAGNAASVPPAGDGSPPATPSAPKTNEAQAGEAEGENADNPSPPSEMVEIVSEGPGTLLEAETSAKGQVSASGTGGETLQQDAEAQSSDVAREFTSAADGPSLSGDGFEFGWGGGVPASPKPVEEIIAAMVKQMNEMLTTDDRLGFLRKRLDWIHPCQPASSPQVNYPLPGVDPTKRVAALESARIISALNQDLKSQTVFLGSFPYSSQVKRFFNYRRRGDFEGQTATAEDAIRPGLFLSGTYGRVYEYEERYDSTYDGYGGPEFVSDKLFPKGDVFPHWQVLMSMLSMPDTYESAVAFDQYYEFVVSQQSSSVNLEPFSERARRLSKASQAALLHHLLRPQTDPTTQLESLSALAKKLRVKSVGGGPPSAEQSVSFEKYFSTNPHSARRLGVDGAADKWPPDLKALANQLSKEDAKKLAALLKADSLDQPVRHLLSDKLLDFLADPGSPSPGKSEIEAFCQPVRFALKIMATASEDEASANRPLSNAIEAFDMLDAHNQQAVVDFLAIGMFLPVGRHALSPVERLIVQTNNVSWIIPLAFTTVVYLPLFGAVSAIGALLGVALLGRDRTNRLIEVERERDDDMISIPEPVEFIGRENLLDRLWRLAGRGWTTIAIVGRRGVGKSRVLQRMYSAREETNEAKFAIRVWIHAPAQYREDEFVEAILEQVARSTESAVARHLGAEPHEVRRLRSSIANNGALWFLAGVGTVWAMISITVGRLERPEIFVSWFPIVFVLLAALGCLVGNRSRIQPIDLTPWLQRDRSYGPHSVLLYRRTTATFRFLAARRSQQDEPTFSGLPLTMIRRVLVSMLMFALVWLLSRDFSILLEGNGVYIEPGMISLAGVMFWLGYVSVVLLQGATRLRATTSLLGLIKEYRAYCEEVTYRIEKGALGSTLGQAPRVAVFIDELDKIVDLNETRDFLRRMKGIFEVPGVYYYMSLARDALRSLQLGSTSGKTEIDSSVDHVLEVLPLPLDECVTVAIKYFTARGISDSDRRLVVTVSAISFGVPRDVLRNCDQAVAGDGQLVTAEKFLSGHRLRQSVAGAELFGWLNDHTSKLTDSNPKEAWAHVLPWSHTAELPRPEAALLSEIRLLSVLEVAVAIDDEAVFERIAEAVCNVGFDFASEDPCESEAILSSIEDELGLALPNAGTTSRQRKATKAKKRRKRRAKKQAAE